MFMVRRFPLESSEWMSHVLELPLSLPSATVSSRPTVSFEVVHDTAVGMKAL